MSAPVCTVAQFTSSTIAASLGAMSRPQRLAAVIYFNALELTAIGGTNYSSNLGTSGSLMAAAKCIHQQLVEQGLITIQYPSIAQGVIAYNNAVNAGGAPASDVNLLSAAIVCLVNFTDAQKMAQYILLQCALGSHKAYPQ